MIQKKRTEVIESDTWNLGSIFKTQSDWEKAYVESEKSIEEVQKFKGSFSESILTFKIGLETYLKSYRLFEKIYAYSHMISDQDTGNAINQGLQQKTLNLYGRLSSATSYIRPEILSIDDKKLESFLNDSSLKPYSRLVREIVKYKPHTLSEKEETLLAEATEVMSSANSIFSQLTNADFKFGSIIEDGQERSLTHSTYASFLRSENRAIRKEAFIKYTSVYEAHKNTIAATLTSGVKRDVFVAKVRKYKSALDLALFPDEVSREVYENLIKVVSKNIHVPHRYYKLRAKILGLEKLEFYDTLVPLIKNLKVNHSYDEACTVIRDSLSPLGEEYTSALYNGILKNRWVDRYENEGKRSGAYQSSCYDSHPFILMNFKEESIDDVFTLTHEAGHAMHTYFSNKAQPYQDHDYPKFSAEVASTFNEQLLSHYLVNKKIKDPALQAYIITHQIDEINATMFRQVMYSEFEKEIHERAERNEPLTVDIFRGIYKDLMTKYMGDSVNQTDMSDLGGMRIPHFYSAFYVYKYATGIAAAVALSRKVLKGGDLEREKFLSFLKGGCSKPPLHLLKDAGVDLTSPEPIEATISHFDELITDLENRLYQVTK
ncbi:MAG: oligoendopeptidase F [bacterium]|nr:oligoendopeptidase F [bacterium]